DGGNHGAGRALDLPRARLPFAPKRGWSATPHFAGWNDRKRHEMTGLFDDRSRADFNSHLNQRIAADGAVRAQFNRRGLIHRKSIRRPRDAMGNQPRVSSHHHARADDREIGIANITRQQTAFAEESPGGVSAQHEPAENAQTNE